MRDMRMKPTKGLSREALRSRWENSEWVRVQYESEVLFSPGGTASGNHAGVFHLSR